MKPIFVKPSSIAFRILILCSLLTASPAYAEEAAGDWGGLLAGQLHVVVHVTKDDNGHYDIEFRSPDQGNLILSTANVEVTEEHLGFFIPKIGGRYAGAWDETRKAW